MNQPKIRRITAREHDEIQRALAEIHDRTQQIADGLAIEYPNIQVDENGGMWDYLGVAAGNLATINHNLFGQTGPIS